MIGLDAEAKQTVRPSRASQAAQQPKEASPALKSPLGRPWTLLLAFLDLGSLRPSCLCFASYNVDVSCRAISYSGTCTPILVRVLALVLWPVE